MAKVQHKATGKQPTGRPKVKMIQSLDPKRNSAAGNPRWEVYFTDGTHMPTKPDAACAFGLGNRENVAPNPVRVWTERGQIVYVEPVKE